MPEDDRPVFKDNPRLTAIDQSAFNERIEQVQKMREECGWGTTTLGAYWEGYEQGMLHVRDYLLDDLVASHARAVEGRHPFAPSDSDDVICGTCGGWPDDSKHEVAAARPHELEQERKFIQPRPYVDEFPEHTQALRRIEELEAALSASRAPQGETPAPKESLKP
jgi:hypothetical protein